MLTFVSVFLFVISGWRRSSWVEWGLSVYPSYLSCSLDLVFEYITAIVWSCWSCDVPPCLWSVPRNLCPAHEVVIELNWVVLCWSCWDVDEVSCASSYCPPPGFLEIYEWYVSLSAFFD